MLKTHKNLVAFWDFSGEGNQALTSKARMPYQLIPAKGGVKIVEEGPLSGYAIELDGKSGFLSLAHEASGELDIKTNQVTVIAWVKWEGGTGFVAGKWNEYADGGKRQYGLFVSLPYYNGADQVCGHISKSGGPTPPFPYSIDYSASKQKVPHDEWTCVAFSYDGQYIRSFLNGKYEAREPDLIDHTKGFLPDQPQGLIQSKNPYYYPEGIGNNASDFTVGAVELKDGMGNFFRGKIGGIAVFNAALTEEEIAKAAAIPAIDP